MLECKSGTALSVWRQVPSLNKKFVGKIFVGDISLSEKFSWMEANHENNEIKSTTKIFTYTVYRYKNNITLSGTKQGKEPSMYNTVELMT